MTAPEALYQSNLTSLPLRARGKVRDIYHVDDRHMLIVTTDRLSAFDVILPDPIPGKGAVLTRISNFWFNKLSNIIPNHLTDIPLSDVVKDAAERTQIEGRAIVVKLMRPLPVEAIVRGYLIGSGWKDYVKTGSVCGILLPTGLQLAQQLPETIYTPSTKAEMDAHDENVAFAKTVELIGETLATQVRDISIRLYQEAADYAKERGIIIADTKFEFGIDENGKLCLIDEALTPDSSRFWPADEYKVGNNPPSFDKQFVRDYLETLDWDKTAPGPHLPKEVQEHCAAKYREAESRLTGRSE
jgi:phosphoribosylaminoimidazole-succinocarboxamide synthase